MKNKVTTLIELVKHLPEQYLDQAIETLEKMKEEAEGEEKKKTPDCPHCHGGNVVRNGHRKGKQQYLCRVCGKSFVRTTGTAFYYSRSGEAVWKQVIQDTVRGRPLEETVEDLAISHETAFNMRHKVLYNMEAGTGKETALTGICESDETYILESYKGKALPDGYWRAARKHRAVSSKGGISEEYICVCAAVERGGKAYSRAVCRGIPRKAEILGAFSGKMCMDTLLVCDGAKSYRVLEEEKVCATVARGTGEFYRINEVNGYHSFIKGRNRVARGFGTKYLNRYNALFSYIFRGNDFLVDDIYKQMSVKGNNYRTIAATQTEGLLRI